MALSLSHSLSHSIIQSIPHSTGKTDQKILEMKDSFGAAFDDCGFVYAFYATDDNNGMSSCHKQGFEEFEYFGPTESLETIVNYLASDRQKTGQFWPIPDFLHLLQNSRSRSIK
jgi:xylose isomerase